MRLLVLALFLMSCSSPTKAVNKARSKDYYNLVDEIQPPFPGYMYKPKNVEKAPVIVLLHGSEGGNGNFWFRPGSNPKTGADATTPWLARYYASRGFVTLALCYFDCAHHGENGKNQPNDLVKVDVQEVVKAYEWAKTTYSSNGKAALWGISRGAELALLTALELQKKTPSATPQLTMALSPPDYVVGSFPKSVAQEIIHGQNSDFTEALKIPAWISGATPYTFKTKINLANYNGPLLISYFTQDTVWHPTVNAKKLLSPFEQKPSEQIISIEMDKKGHGYDRFGTKEFQLHVRALNKAMDEFLK
jgi:acetyl esterase/lipase